MRDARAQVSFGVEIETEHTYEIRYEFQTRYLYLERLTGEPGFDGYPLAIRIWP